MATPAEGDPVKRASQEIALMIQRARDDEASKARVLIEKVGHAFLVVLSGLPLTAHRI